MTIAKFMEQIKAYFGPYPAKRTVNEAVVLFLRAKECNDAWLDQVYARALLLVPWTRPPGVHELSEVFRDLERNPPKIAIEPMKKNLIEADYVPAEEGEKILEGLRNKLRWRSVKAVADKAKKK